MTDIAQKMTEIPMLGLKSYFPYLLGQKKTSLTDYPSEDVSRLAQFANVSYQTDRPESIQGFGQNIPKYTNEDIASYVDPNSKKINVSIRGTDLTDLEKAKKDIRSDIFGVALGKTIDDPRFYEAKRVVESLKREYPNYEISTYGTSLGGSIGRQIAREMPDVKSISFNPGAGLGELTQKAPKKSKVYRVRGDIISRAVGDAEVFEPSSYYSHGLQNFIR